MFSSIHTKMPKNKTIVLSSLIGTHTLHANMLHALHAGRSFAAKQYKRCLLLARDCGTGSERAQAGVAHLWVGVAKKLLSRFFFLAGETKIQNAK